MAQDYETMARIDAELPREEKILENLKQEMQKERNSNEEV